MTITQKYSHTDYASSQDMHRNIPHLAVPV